MKLFHGFFNKINSERKLILKFRESGACSIELAKSLDEIGEVNRSIFNRFVRKGIIEGAERGSYFLNEMGLMKYRMNRTKWGMALLFFLLVMIILFKGNY